MLEKIKKSKNKTVKENKNPKKRFDVVIIGAGQTGLTLAKYLIKKEISVLLIDKDDIGIKSSLDLKNFVKLSKRMRRNNWNPNDFIKTLAQRLSHINKEQNDDFVSSLKENSFFEFIKGEIQEIGDYSLNVNNEEYNFRKAVFATGSYYEDVNNLPNLSRNMYFNLDELRKVDKIYKNVAIYGTNIEALELAYAFANLGSHVYLFDENVNIFNDFDDNLEAIIKTQLSPENIQWCLETKITNHYWSSDTEIRIEYTSQGVNKFIDVDKIFVTGNKKSETRDLKTKYELPLNSKGSIIIDNTFKVKDNPNFYAIGDVNGILMNPNQATFQAITLSNYLLGEKKSKFNLYNKTFTIDVDPEISFHGMNKHDLEFLNIKYNEFIFDFNGELNSKLLDQRSKVKIYTNEKHEILGVFIYGSKTRELISLFIIMMANKIKFHKLSNYNFAFYSKSEGLRMAALEYELEFVGFSKKIQKLKSKNKGE